MIFNFLMNFIIVFSIILYLTIVALFIYVLYRASDNYSLYDEIIDDDDDMEKDGELNDKA